MIVIAPKFLKLQARMFHGKEIAETARAAAFFPFIIVRSKEEIVPWLINHEKIHFRQEIEGVFIFFYFLYVAEKFYARYVLKLKPLEAYLWTSAEQEAYCNQNNPEYLGNNGITSLKRKNSNWTKTNRVRYYSSHDSLTHRRHRPKQRTRQGQHSGLEYSDRYEIF